MTALMSPRHLIIDTDIGTDVDDALVLLQIIGTQLEGDFSIATAYGDVHTRARIAENYCRKAGVDVEIYPGVEKTFSGREVWVSGLEGTLHENIEEMRVMIDEKSAIDHYCEKSAMDGFAIDVLAIAPLTNIAEVLEADNFVKESIDCVYMMGGRFSEGKNEHNIVSDIIAAKRVMESDLRIDIVGIEITSKMEIELNVFSDLANLSEATKLLMREAEQWAKFWNRDWIVPHDSIAFLMRSNPELFEFSGRGDVKVSTSGSTDFIPNSKGTKRVVKNFDVEKGRQIIERSLRSVRFNP